MHALLFLLHLPQRIEVWIDFKKETRHMSLWAPSSEQQSAVCVHVCEAWSWINVKRVLDSRESRCSSPPPSLNSTPGPAGLGLHREHSEETDFGNFSPPQFECNQEQSLALVICAALLCVLQSFLQDLMWIWI